MVRQRLAQAERDGDFSGVAGIDPADTAVPRHPHGAGARSPTSPTGRCSSTRAGPTTRTSSVGDTYTLEKTPKGKLELRVAGIFADNPVIFFPTVTTLETLKQQGYPDRGQLR